MHALFDRWHLGPILFLKKIEDFLSSLPILSSTSSDPCTKLWWRLDSLPEQYTVWYHWLVAWSKYWSDPEKARIHNPVQPFWNCEKEIFVCIFVLSYFAQCNWAIEIKLKDDFDWRHWYFIFWPVNILHKFIGIERASVASEANSLHFHFFVTRLFFTLRYD